MSAGPMLHSIPLRSLAAAALVLLVSSPAAATSVHGRGHGHGHGYGHERNSSPCGSPCQGPGIALSDLISGEIESFDSRNLGLTFSNFSLDFSGEDAPDLSSYRVLPVSNGFTLFSFGKSNKFSKSKGRNGSPSFDFALQYEVTAADGLGIEGIQLGLLGGSSGSAIGVSLDAFDAEGEDRLAELALGAGSPTPGFCWPGQSRRNKRWDSAKLGELTGTLLIEEQISGLGGANWAVSHRFKTAPIPEPTTALMLGAGLLGLGIAGRRRP